MSLASHNYSDTKPPNGLMLRCLDKSERKKMAASVYLKKKLQSNKLKVRLFGDGFTLQCTFPRWDWRTWTFTGLIFIKLTWRNLVGIIEETLVRINVGVYSKRSDIVIDGKDEMEALPEPSTNYCHVLLGISCIYVVQFILI